MVDGCRRVATYILLTLAFSIVALDARAQDPMAVGPFAVDLRVAMPRFGQNERVAAQRDLSALQLPAWGLGLDVGAHVYPVKWKMVTFGVGVQALISEGTRSPTTEEAENNPDLPVIRTTLNTIAPQFSLNFGGTSGWSYISTGLGTSTFNVGSAETDLDDRRFSTLNYGGGGKWFAKDHLAFSVDLRFYAISPQGGTDKLPALASGGQAGALPRLKLMVFSIGVSFK